MRVLLAGGGTAGHTSPLLATAAVLRDRGVEITCLGTPRGLEVTLIPQAGVPLELVPPVPLPRRPGKALAQVPGRLRAAVKATADVIDRVEPDVIVG
ncbi:MAG: murG, partial [Aeromicrobium sp.]|nr:murG [Aeromicrobium sp.]